MTSSSAAAAISEWARFKRSLLLWLTGHFLCGGEKFLRKWISAFSWRERGRGREKKNRQISDGFLHPHLSQTRQIRYWLSRDCSEKVVKGSCDCKRFFKKTDCSFFSLYNVKKSCFVQQSHWSIVKRSRKFFAWSQKHIAFIVGEKLKIIQENKTLEGKLLTTKTVEMNTNKQFGVIGIKGKRNAE